MIAYYAMQPGIKKHNTEDRILIGNSIFQTGIGLVRQANLSTVAIADGVGGNQGAAEAAQFVVQRIGMLCAQERSPDEMNIREVLLDVNRQLLCFGESMNMPNMATTLTGICFMNQHAYCFHLGNTRLYSIQGGYLRQVTHDQTMQEWMRTQGRMNATEGYCKSTITSCMGGGSEQFAEALSIILLEDWHDGRGWVFTSDGVHEFVDPDELDLLCCEPDQLEAMCKHVLQDALDHGSQDDCSILVVRNQ